MFRSKEQFCIVYIEKIKQIAATAKHILQIAY